MEIRSGRRKYKVFAYDVESHNDDATIEKGETSIWLSSFIDDASKMEDESNYYYDIDTWLDKLEQLSTVKRHKKNEKRPVVNLLIFIYNLSFEWSFILPKLLERGFMFKEHIEKDDEFCFSSISTKSVSSVWSATIKFGKKCGTIMFRDLCKIFPGGLRKVAESFGLPTQKGDIDYKLNRLPVFSYKGRKLPYMATKAEKEYCFKDTKILMDILVEMARRDDKDFWRATSAASYASRKMIHAGWPRSYKPMKQFRKQYPVLCKEESEFLRHSVGGGITYAPVRWQFKDIQSNIAHIDLHQAHPSSAYYNLFPYGEGEYFKGRPPFKARINCVHIRISYTDVILHSVIKLIGLPFIDNYELWVWDFEIPTMYKCYADLKIEYIDGYSYKRKRLPWRDFYANNYRLRAKAKKEDDLFNIMYYKLLNNSSYGKLLERGHNEIYQNYLDPNTQAIDSIVIDKPEDEWRDGSTYTYLGVGACIPARTRVTLVEAALQIDPTGKSILYFDTDSIFFLSTPETEKRAKTLDYTDFLGGWGREKDIVRAQFSAPKRYKIIEKNGNKLEFVPHLAGFNGFEDYAYDELDIINAKYEVQRIRRVKGGTVIIMAVKKVEVQPKYMSIYQENMLK